MSLDDLVRAALRGERRAWRPLTRTLERKLARYFRRWFDGPDVEDLCQNTLATVARKLPMFEFRDGQPFMAWVYGIARLEVLKAQHQQARRAAQKTACASAQQSPSTSLGARIQRLELHAILSEEIADLPGPYRRAVENYVEDEESKALAEREGITPRGARTRLRRARLMLGERTRVRSVTPRKNPESPSSSPAP